MAKRPAPIGKPVSSGAHGHAGKPFRSGGAVPSGTAAPTGTSGTAGSPGSTAPSARPGPAPGALDAARIDLLVCTTCRRGEAPEADAPRPGARLADALDTADLPDAVRVTRVECFSNCKGGCTIALRGAGRWTYVYGNLDAEADLPVILEGTARYAETLDGVVPWRARPEHFKRNCIARIPPLPET